jgi:dipeptidyl aminopeptidase/acylaminoacyl peptidase
MSEYRPLLERARETFPPLELDLGEVYGRRERKQRNRRIRAGVVGVLVVLAAGFALVRTLTSDGIPATPPVEPAPAPLSGAIAYDDLKGQIYVAGLDGSNAVAIADVGAIDDDCPDGVHTHAPSWSPDGRYLAFSRFTECVDPTRHDIVIADLQGNVVDSFRVSVGFPNPIAWSPDSTRVAVWDEFGWGARGVGTFTMGVYGIDGTSATFPMPDGWEHPTFKDPIWTPDGDALIVGELEIPLDGGTPREVPFHGTFQDPSGGVWTGALVYSPDGSQMAYGTPRGLMVARADGSDPRAVSDDGAHTAAWSPNGELIAVASATPGTDQFTRVPRHGAHDQAPDRLRIVDVATGSVTVLSQGEGTFFNVIGFSPDGDRVLFGEHRPVAGQPEGTYLDSIWSIRIDGSDARQIAVGTYTGDLRPA